MSLVEKLYIDVEARATKAKAELENLRKVAQKAQEPLNDEIKKLKTRLQLREAYLEKTKEEQKAIREQLKLQGRRVLNEKEELKSQEKISKLKDKIVAQNKEIEKSKDIVKAKKEFEQEERRQKTLSQYNDRRKAEIRDYTEFVKRSSMESGRYADKLDKRDRTRSLRENLRRGMEKGTAISERYHSEENAVYKLERSLGIASTAFDRVRHPAERLTDAFYAFQRIAYAAQSALGVLAGTIGDMVGGLMGLVGVAGAAAGSLIAVAGAMANLGAGMMTAKFALSGVGAAVQQLWSGQNQYNRALRDAKKAFRDLRFEAEDAALSEQEAAIALEKAREALARVQDLPADSRTRREAELEFQRAELNYRRAKARVKDTNDALKKGPNANVDRSQDPLANLTKSQIAFAKYLVTLKPVIQELKEAAASSFLPPLQKAIDVVVKNVFPTLKAGLNDIGGALGDASRNFTDAFKDKENIDLFRDFLTNSKPTIRILGAVAANAFGGILAILKAAQPITDRFARWIFTVSERFDQLGKGDGQDNLKKFFKLAGDVASELGTAFKLVFGGLKNIVEATFPNGANSGAGGVILQWIKEIGAGFKAFTGDKGFAEFLKNSTENAKTALSTLGSFLKIFLDLAGRPETKEFWTIIESAVPYVRKILDDGLKAGPAFGKLIVAIAEFISLLSEGTALQTFFTTFQMIINATANFVRAIKPVLDVLGAVHGVFLALVAAGALFRKGIQIIMGIMMKLLRVAGAASTGFQNFKAKLVAAREDGGKGFRGILDSLQKIRLEMINIKRIELLKDIAKGDKQRQITALKDKMALLNLNTKKGQIEAKKLQTEIGNLERSYKKLKIELMANGKAAKNWGDLVKSSAESAKFGLDKYAATQRRIGIAGKVGTGLVGASVGVSSISAGLSSGTGMGGFGAGLSAVGGLGMMSMNPIGMGAGAVASIAGAIVSGFEQANAEKEAAKEQKRIEIKAKLAEVTAEKISQTQTTVGAFVGRGATVESAVKRASTLEDIAQTQQAKLGINETKASAEAIVAAISTSDVLGDAAFKVGGTQKLTDAVLKLIATDSFTQEGAIAAVEKAFTGRKGKTGLEAVSQLAAENVGKKTSYDPVTGAPTVSIVTPAQRAAEAKKNARAELEAFNQPRLEQAKDLATDIGKTGSDFKKRTALQKQLAAVLTEIDTKNKQLGKLAGKTNDITTLLESTTFASGFYKGTNTFKGLGIPLAGQADTKTGIYAKPQPFSSQFLDPKTKIYYNTSSEYQALTSGYLGELLRLVKENPKKTTIELKDKTGKLLVFDIDNSVGGGTIP